MFSGRFGLARLPAPAMTSTLLTARIPKSAQACVGIACLLGKDLPRRILVCNCVPQSIASIYNLARAKLVQRFADIDR